MIRLLDLLFILLSIPVLGASGYLFVLALFARRPADPEGPGPTSPRFDVVVPAHDEATGIRRTLASLRALDYPEDRFRIVVVADNCTDDTAAIARAEGALVLVRDDPARRGKGYALAHAFARLEDEPREGAVVVIDADTEVSRNLLRAFARRLEIGALAAQATYRVRNAEDSWRTRLLVIALALFHDLRSLARERLGLSVGLRGNGMCLAREALRRVPYSAFSLVEDIEYGIRLGEAGIRTHHVYEATVHGDMAVSKGADTQRRRWEEGRARIAIALGPRLILRAIRTRDRVLLDLGLDTIVPPLAQLALAITAFTLGAAVSWAALGGSATAVLPWLAALLMLLFYVLRGLAISRTGLAGVRALLWAPVYVLWKVGLWIWHPRGTESEWIRTRRRGERT